MSNPPSSVEKFLYRTAIKEAGFHEALEKGAPVIAERIRAALDKWEKNWAPKYNRVVAVVRNLPPKTLDWNTNIERRLKPVVAAWKGQK